jgi:hypothetical protein
MFKKQISKALDKYYSLCTPAQVYFLLSTVSFLAILYQNVAVGKKYVMGKYSVNLKHNNIFVFIVKAIYILVWTFILNELCRNGWSGVSWFLVFLPIELMFILLAVILMANM